MQMGFHTTKESGLFNRPTQLRHERRDLLPQRREAMLHSELIGTLANRLLLSGCSARIPT